MKIHWRRLFWRCSKIYKNNKYTISVGCSSVLIFFIHLFPRRVQQALSSSRTFSKCALKCLQCAFWFILFWAQIFCQLTRLRHGPILMQWRAWTSWCSLRMPGMGVRGVIRACSYPFIKPKRQFHNMNPQVYQNLLYHRYRIDIPYLSWYILGYPWLSLTYTVFAEHYAHSAPISICPGRTNGRHSWRALICLVQLYFTCWFALPSFISPATWDPGMGGPQQALARMATTISKFIYVLQHLRSAGPAWFRSDGNSSRCKVVPALSNAHSLCGPRLKWAEVSALDALVSLRKLYVDHPTMFL